MQNEHTVNGLLRKRAEIAGKIEDAQAQLRQFLIDLDSVDYTLRLFKPDIDLAEVKPKPLPPRHAAFKGEVSRCVLTALREAKGPMNTQQLAHLLMAERGMNTNDKRTTQLIVKRVGACLKHHRNRGLVRVVPQQGHRQFQFWELAQ